MAEIGRFHRAQAVWRVFKEACSRADSPTTINCTAVVRTEEVPTRSEGEARTTRRRCANHGRAYVLWKHLGTITANTTTHLAREMATLSLFASPTNPICPPLLLRTNELMTTSLSSP